MKYVLSIAIAIVLLLSCAVSYAEEDETFEVEAVVVAWEAVGNNELLYTAVEKHGTEWQFYGEPDEFSLGSCIILTVWIPTNEILDVEEIEIFTPEEVAHYIEFID